MLVSPDVIKQVYFDDFDDFDGKNNGDYAKLVMRAFNTAIHVAAKKTTKWPLTFSMYDVLAHLPTNYTLMSDTHKVHDVIMTNMANHTRWTCVLDHSISSCIMNRMHTMMYIMYPTRDNA